MASLYNLGIGLTAVDSASKPVKAVDAALVSLSKSTDSAGTSADAFGGSLDNFTASSLEAARSGRDAADVADMLAEQLGSVGNRAAYAHAAQQRFTEGQQALTTSLTSAESDANDALSLLTQTMGHYATGTKTAAGHTIQMRDALGRFTRGEIKPTLEGIAGATGNLIEKTGILFRESKGASGFARLGDQLKDVGGAITGAVQSFEQLSFLGSYAEPMLEFEDATQKMAMGLGGSADQAFKLRTEMIGLVTTTQFSTEEVLRMSQGLANAGVALTGLAEQQQKAFIALNDLYGVSGEAIAGMDNTMRAFGGNLSDTLDEAAQFQSKFQIPGVFQELPEIISGAESSVIQFGDAVVGSVPQIVRSVMRTAGVFAKTYGKTVRESVQAAQKDFDLFASASRQHEDVFLGLETSFHPIQKTLMEIGVPLMRTADLMRLGQENALDYAEEMRGVYLSLGEGSFQARRFSSQMRRAGMSKEMMGLVFVHGRLADARATEREDERKKQENIRTGVASFEGLTKGMLDTTKELRKMWGNVKDLGKAFLTQTGLTDLLKAAFAGAKDTLADWTGRIAAFIKSGSMREWREDVQKAVPVLKTAGKWFLIGGTAVGTFVSALGGLFSGIAALKAFGKTAGFVSRAGGGIFKMLAPAGLRTAGDFLMKLLPRLASKIVKFIPGIGQLYAVFVGVKTAFKEMSDVLGDPQASGAEKLQAMFKGAAKGIFAAFDAILLGIPGWLTDKFFPDLERKFDKGVDGLFGGLGDVDIGKTLGKLWDKATGWLGEKLGGLANWIREQLPSMSEVKAELFEWGKTIGKVVGGLLPMLWDVLVFALWDLNPFAQMNKFIYDILTEGWSGGVEKFKSGFLGKIWSTVWPYVWDVIKFTFWDMNPAVILYKMFKGAVTGGWDGMIDGVSSGESKLWGIVTSIWGKALSGAGALLEGVAEGMLNSFGSSLKELGLTFKIAWLKVSHETLAVFEDIGKAWTTTVSRPIEDAMVSILFGTERAWNTIVSEGEIAWYRLSQSAMAGFNLMVMPLNALVNGIARTFVNALHTIVGEVKKLWEKLPQIIREKMPGFETFNEWINKTSNQLSNFTVPSWNIIGTKDVDNAEQMASKIAKIREETNKASEANEKLVRKSLKTDRQKEDRQSKEQQRARLLGIARGEREKKRAGEARKNAQEIRKLGASHLESALRRIEKGAGTFKFDTGAFRLAQDSVREGMEASLRSITARVAKGSLSMDKAQALLGKVEAEGVGRALEIGKKAMRKVRKETREPGKVSDAATKKQDFRTDAKALQSMVESFVSSRRTQQMRQKIEIQFPQRSGDFFTRHLARESKARGSTAGMGGGGE